MRAVVHETPGLIDIRSFTVFGINSKPNSKNPIGRFGTGLKYAVAVLCREGCEVTVWIGENPHVFFTKTKVFRDKEFAQLYMRRRRGITAKWMATELPYTTEYGKDWQVWMALRELHSNTLDEGGKSYAQLIDDPNPDGFPGQTRIVVTGQKYEEAFDKLFEVFMPNASGGHLTQVVPQPSKVVYFRGLRAMDLKEPSVLTYNINESMVLTEDRTIKEPYSAEYYAKRAVMGSTDKALITKVLTADDDKWESKFTYYETDSATDEFKSLAANVGRKSAAQFGMYHVRAAQAKSSPVDWRQQIITAINTQDRETIGQVVTTFADELTELLRDSLTEKGSDREPEVDTVSYYDPKSLDEVGDDIPF